MSRQTNGRMNRRDFLRTAAGITGSCLFARSATARHLVLVSGDDAELIARIEWIPYDSGRRDGDAQTTQRCAVRLTTSGGAQGWADFALRAMPDKPTAAAIRDIILGQAPANHDGLWRRLYEEGVNLDALAAVDVALWDLRGRMAGQPVHALLGSVRQQVEACLCTGFNLGEPADYAQQAQQAQDSGIGAIKVQPYIDWGVALDDRTDVGFPDKDMAIYSAVREAVGADYVCMADSQSGYTYDEALRVGRLLDDLSFAWYESPMPETQAWIDRYIALAGELRTPICGPETDPDAYAARLKWIDKHACDVARISIYHGGFSACVQLASACQQAGIRLTLQQVDADSYPYLQLIGATSAARVPYFEIGSPYRDLETLPSRATPEPVFDGSGQIAIPQTPGMGVELDWAYITKNRTD